MEKKKKFRELGAFAIADVLIPAERHDVLFPQKDWYAVLYEYLALENGGKGRGPVNVVTLNYDRSLEHFLTNNILYNCPDEDETLAMAALSEIEIVHAHGSLGPYPAVPYGAPDRNEDFIKAAAKRIRIVSDALDDELEFKRARRLLSEGEQIVFVGFGFDNRTLRLPFREISLEKKKLFATGLFLPTQKREEVIKTLGQNVTFGNENETAESFVSQVLRGGFR